MIVLGLALLAPGAAAQTPPAPFEELEPLDGAEDGEVVLEILVSAEGWVTGLSVVQSSGEPSLDLAALQLALDARFSPALDADGTPVASAARLRIAVVGPEEERDDLLYEDDIEEVVVVGTAEAEVSEQVVTLEDIRYLPGSGGDVVRTVQNLPGIARPPFSLGQLLVRGTAPEDSSYYLDGMRLPIVFHFGGLSTVINGDTLSDVKFLAGGYGVRYGRSMGGVVDLRTTQTLPKKTRGYASVDLFQATGFADVRVGRTGLTLSARRSYIDTLVGGVINNAVEQTVRAPRFFDVSARVLHDAPGPGRLDLLWLLSSDAFRVLEPPPEPETTETATEDPPFIEEPEPVEDGQPLVNLGIDFWKARLRYVRESDSPWRGEVSVIVGPEEQRFDVDPDGVALQRNVTLSTRSEVERVRGDDVAVGLLFGVETRLESASWSFDVPTFGRPDSGEALAVTAGAYAEATAGVGPLEITQGVRSDARLTDGPTYLYTVDPRTILRWDASRDTDVEASIGSYSQFPTLRQVESSESWHLQPQRLASLTLGVHQQVTTATDVRATAFTSQLNQLVVGRQDAFSFFTTPPVQGFVDSGIWANDGIGNVWGMELQLRTRSRNTVGWLSATLSRSFRRDRPGQQPHPFAYDQPVNLVGLVSHRLSKGWRLGTRLRFSSGTPYTPVSNTIDFQEERVVIPLFGPTYSARLAPYFTADVRFDKQWTFDRWKLSTYVDVTNVTNRANEELMTFTERQFEERPITGLPIVPAFGIRADL
ncbi:MAG: TonB family protein [Myxococcales bacterium]|nr:TonB family protein [Myxococcales bacterium]